MYTSGALRYKLYLAAQLSGAEQLAWSSAGFVLNHDAMHVNPAGSIFARSS
jgi:hypothetical protein